jgi:DNA-binding IclR family transcriptional regulator
VLKALTDANGGAMTASEVASATGLGRASVSTTLSKLAKSGEVSKANRGYQLSKGGATGSTSSAAAGTS